MDSLSLDAPSPRSGPWRVSTTWLIDSDQCNEWLSEEDYEVDEMGRKKFHKIRMSVEDLINPSNDADRNRWDKCVVKLFFGNFSFLFFTFFLIITY